MVLAGCLPKKGFGKLMICFMLSRNPLVTLLPFRLLLVTWMLPLRLLMIHVQLPLLLVVVCRLHLLPLWTSLNMVDLWVVPLPEMLMECQLLSNLVPW